MIDIEQIKKWYPENFQHKFYERFILREYMLYKILDFLSNSKYAKKLCFIGGTNLRMLHGIDRFSEDLDFDHKELSRNNFLLMTDSVILFLKKSGYRVFADDKEKDAHLNAYRRNLVFPEFLYENKLSAFKEEKFLIKIESQDQGKNYMPENALISGCGFVFRFHTAPVQILCAMKISALLNRKKGRDFFDVMFLLGKSDPDYDFLTLSVGIKNKEELKSALLSLSENVNIKHKAKDFEHLLFSSTNNKRILLFKDFVENW